MKTGFVIVGLACGVGIHAQAQLDKSEQYREMLLKRPENAVLFGRMVDAWLEKGEMAGLKERLEAATTTGNSMDWRLLAVFRNFTGDEAGAILALDEALKVNPDDPQTRLARAKSLGTASRFEDAIADLDLALKDPATLVEAGTLKGKYLARAGRPAEAVAAWKEIIAAHPEDEGLQEDLIELEIGEGMLEEAVASARELAAKTRDPYQKALRRMHAAEILSLSGKKNEAVDEYKLVFDVSADGSWLEREVLARVNALYSREDDTAGLRNFYQSMRDAYPRRMVVKKEAARNLMTSGDGDEAVAMFREVLKVLPGDREARDEFIALLVTAGRYKEAAEEISSLLATAGQDGALWLKLAEIRKLADDPKGMAGAVEKAVALAPDGEAGKVAVAAIYQRFAMTDDAMRILRAAAREHGINGEAGEALAIQLVSNGNAEEALGIWKEMAKSADREGLLRIVRSLTANGRAVDAFGILQSRMEDFGDDPLLLAAFCQTAQFSDQPELAIPQAMELVRQSKTTGDLETALRQASSLISRAKDPAQWLAKLTEKKDASPHELCLLAELHESLGDSLEAEKILKQAMNGGDPLMVAAQRVRLFEMRGDIDAAIAATREWIALPGGMRTEQIKRLVGLYERADKLEAAIEETANWKRIAPGDKAAWTKRAELFLTEGKPEESVAELRRAIAKFGGDEEMKSKLADALSEAGLFAESWSMFNGLYDEADGPSSKIKWALSLAKLAAREGREDELVNDFRRRARDNPSSTVPLLALAEMFREWQRPEDELSVVTEASRRKPEDVSLLLRQADIEEDGGSLEKAEAMIRKALRIEDSAENRRRLSAFWIRNGDTERGLAEMLAARGQAAGPRETERLVMSLVDARDWSNALRVLTPEVARHPDDWRLGYLHASILHESGAVDEALKHFAGLLGTQRELEGVTPLIPANQIAWLMQDDTGLGDFKRLAYFRNIADPSNIGPYSFGAGQSALPIPGTCTELLPMALCRALSIAASAGTPEERARRMDLIQSPEIRDLAFIKAVYPLKPGELRERLLADGTDPLYYQWYLETGNYSYRNDGRRDSAELGIWKKGVDVTLAGDPKLALQLMARLPLEGEFGLGAEGAGHAVRLLEAMTEEEQWQHASLLQGVAGADPGTVPAELRNKAEAMLLAMLENEEAKNASWIASSLALRWLREGRFDEAVELINKTEAAAKRSTSKTANKQMSNPYSAYGWQGRRGLEDLKFPQILFASVSHTYRSELAKDMEVEGIPRNEKVKQILKIVGDDGEQADKPDRKPIDPEGLTKVIPMIHGPALRLLLANVIGNPKLVADTINDLEKSHAKDPSVLVMIAAYRISVDNDELSAYNLLAEAANLSIAGGSRDSLDGYLYQIGARLAEKPPAGFDIDPARRAALRMRGSMSASDETKQQLASDMVKLGLDEQSKRYTAAPKRMTSGGSSYGMRTSRSNQAASDRLAVTALMTDGKRDAAARRLVAALRKARLRTSSGSGSNYEERQVIEVITGLKLEDEVAAILKPSGDAGYNSKRDYALTLVEMKRGEFVLPVLRELARTKPDDYEVKAMLLQALPKEEQRDYVMTLSDARFDADRIGNWFKMEFERRDSRKVDDFFRTLEWFILFLEKIPVSFEVDRNLSWVNYIAKDVFDPVRFDDANLTSLSPQKAASSNKVDEAKSKVRNELAVRLFHAMMKHPQTSEQGFILCHSMREPLGMTDSSLEQAAVECLRLGILLKEDREMASRFGGNRNYQRWMWRTANGGTSGGSPALVSVDPFACFAQSKAGDAVRRLLSPEWMKELETAEPQKAAELAEAIDITRTEGLTAFQKWIDAQKEAPETLFQRMPWLIRIAYLNGRQDMLNAAVETICEVAVRNPQEAQGEFIHLSELLQLFVKGCGSYQERVAGIERITTRILGPKAAWPLYRELGGSYGRESVYVRRSLHQTLLQSMNESLDCAVAFAGFLAKNRMEGLSVLNLSDQFTPFASAGDPELFVRTCIDHGLLSLGPEFVVLCEGEQQTIADEIWLALAYFQDGPRKKMGELLAKLEGKERLWARVLAARINNDTPALLKELNSNSKAILSWPESARADFSRLLLAWFPDVSSLATGSFKWMLDESRKSGNAASRKMAETYLKEGFPQSLQAYSVDEGLTRDVLRIIGDDPGLAAKVWVKALEHFENHRGSWSSSNNGFQQSQEEYVNYQLMNSTDESDLTLAKFADFIHRVDEERPGGLRGLFNSNGGYYLRQMFTKQLALYDKAIRTSGDLKPLSENCRPMAWTLTQARDATPGSLRPVLAALIAMNAFYDMPSSAESKELLKWMRNSKMKWDPVLTDVAKLIFIPPDEKGADFGELKESFSRFMEYDSIPLLLRLEVVVQFMSQSKVVFWKSDPKCLSVLAGLFADALQQGAPWVSRDFTTTLGQISVAGGLSKVDAVKLSSAVKGNRPAIARGSSSSAESMVSQILFSLAVRIGDSSEILGLARDGGDVLRGDFEMIVMLMAENQSAAAVQLIARPGEYHSGFERYLNPRLPDGTRPRMRFHRKLESHLSEQLSAIEDGGQRFRVECLISSLQDEENDERPSVARKDRIAALVERFPQEAPSARVSRNETLAALALDASQSAILAGEFDQAIGNQKLGMLLALREMDSNRSSNHAASYVMESLIQCAMRYGIEERQDVAIALDQFASLQNASVGNQSYRVSEFMNRIGPWYSGLIVRTLALQPDAGREDLAKKSLEVAEVLLEPTRRGASDTELVRAGVALAIVSQALAGNGAALDQWVESLPKSARERYDVARSRSDLGSIMRNLKPALTTGENSERIRRTVLTSLLGDPVTMQREIKHMTVISTLLGSGAFEKQDVFAVIDGLPNDHPRRAEFMCEKAGIIGWRGGTQEDAIAAYGAAEAAAGEDRKLVDFIRSYHAMYLDNRLKRLDDAMKICRTIQLDQLPERERKTMESIIKRVGAKSKVK